MATTTFFTQNQNRYVLIEFGCDTQMYQVDQNSLVHLVSTQLPSDFTLFQPNPEMIFWVKETIQLQETNISLIAKKLQIPLPKESLQISSAFVAWIEHHGQNVTSLDLSGLNLTMLPPQIRFFKHLQELNISNNQLRRLPPQILEFTQLTHLNCAGNPLEYLPNLSNLKDLAVLNLQCCSLGLVPEWLNTMALTSIDLTKNVLYELPFWFSTWRQGKEVSLDSYLDES